MPHFTWNFTVCKRTCLGVSSIQKGKTIAESMQHNLFINRIQWTSRRNVTFRCILSGSLHNENKMSQCMRFPTMLYVRPATPQISASICAVWLEPLLVVWVFYDCKATDWTPFGVSKLKRRLQRLVWVYTLLEILCHGSNVFTTF